jgi:hypothetical protein
MLPASVEPILSPLDKRIGGLRRLRRSIKQHAAYIGALPTLAQEISLNPDGPGSITFHCSPATYPAAFELLAGRRAEATSRGLRLALASPPLLIILKRSKS